MVAAVDSQHAAGPLASPSLIRVHLYFEDGTGGVTHLPVFVNQERSNAVIERMIAWFDAFRSRAGLDAFYSAVQAILSSPVGLPLLERLLAKQGIALPPRPRHSDPVLFLARWIGGQAPAEIGRNEWAITFDPFGVVKEVTTKDIYDARTLDQSDRQSD